MNDLDPTRELARQSWRAKIARYISGEALHLTAGGYTADEDVKETGEPQ